LFPADERNALEDLGIAVFGSSEPRPGDPLFEQAVEVGGLLARAGHAVVTGGYGGVMEAASRGAAESGGHAIGVTCSIFSDRAPNPYLTHEIPTRDLAERTRELVDRSRGFVVLEGRAGTLSELSFLWALERAGCLESRPVIVLCARFEALLERLASAAILEQRQVEMTRLANSADEVLRILTHALQPADSAQPEESER
jgi:uncharacterized protein (TIGR00730 family)